MPADTPSRIVPAERPIRVVYPTFRVRHVIVPLLAFAAGMIIGRTTSRPIGNPRVPEPARPVELDRYLGRWYELARYDAGFEHDCEGVTADYTLRSDGLIGVLNTCRRGGTDGPARTATGKAKIIAGSDNTKLKVAFFGSLFIGDYWVLDHDEDYAWSIVGEPSGTYLWLLSRDPTPGKPAISRLVARARQLGYDTAMLRMTRQPPV